MGKIFLLSKENIIHFRDCNFSLYFFIPRINLLFRKGLWYEQAEVNKISIEQIILFLCLETAFTSPTEIFGPSVVKLEERKKKNIDVGVYNLAGSYLKTRIKVW